GAAINFYSLAEQGGRGTLGGNYFNTAMNKFVRVYYTFDSTATEVPALPGIQFGTGTGEVRGVAMRGGFAYGTGRILLDTGVQGFFITKFANPLPDPLATEYGWIFQFNPTEAGEAVRAGSAAALGTLGEDVQATSLPLRVVNTGALVGGVYLFEPDGQEALDENTLLLQSPAGDLTANALALSETL